MNIIIKFIDIVGKEHDRLKLDRRCLATDALLLQKFVNKKIPALCVIKNHCTNIVEESAYSKKSGAALVPESSDIVYRIDKDVIVKVLASEYLK